MYLENPSQWKESLDKKVFIIKSPKQEEKIVNFKQAEYLKFLSAVIYSNQVEMNLPFNNLYSSQDQDKKSNLKRKRNLNNASIDKKDKQKIIESVNSFSRINLEKLKKDTITPSSPIITTNKPTFFNTSFITNNQNNNEKEQSSTLKKTFKIQKMSPPKSVHLIYS